ncbi:hypothetical protein GCM10010399_82850 [Dactylosporangium fulvum]
MANESDVPPVTLTMPPVAAEGVASIRRSVTDAAHRAGFPPDRADLFTVAVNEIVINAIEHGGGAAMVTIIQHGPTITVEVRDTGSGVTGTRVPVQAPPVDQPNGRGLWLASRLCDELTFHPQQTGAMIRLRSTA